jgi:hypothetical protein
MSEQNRVRRHETGGYSGAASCQIDPLLLPLDILIVCFGVLIPGRFQLLSQFSSLEHQKKKDTSVFPKRQASGIEQDVHEN